MKITFVQPYHPNIKDSLLALSTSYDVEIIVDKKIDLPKGVRAAFFKAVPINAKGRSLLYRIYRSFITSILNIRRVLKTINNSDYVVIKHFYEPRSITTCIASRIKNIPILVQIQQINKFHRRYNLLFLLLRTFLYPKNTKIFSVTKEGYENLRRYYADTFYIPSCINSQHYKIKKWTRASNFLRVIYVSKFQKRKKIDLLIKALHKVKEEYGIGIQIKIISIVENSDEYRKERSKILRLITQLHMKDSVQFHMNIKHKDMNKFYNWADLFIFPAISEPLGYSLVEAMACGLPVICSEEIGAKSYVEVNKNGYIFRANEEEAILCSVKKFIKNDTIQWNKLEKFGKHSREIIAKKHNPTIFLMKFKKMIENE